MQKNVTCLVDTPSATDSGYDWPSAPSGQLVPLQWRCGFAFRPTGFHVSERLHSYCEAFRTHACAGWSPKSSCKTAPRGETSVAIQWSPRCPEVSDRGSYDGHLGLLGEIDMGRSTFAAICACMLLFTATTANAHFYSGNDLYRMCRGSIDEVEQCLGYVEGVADAIEELPIGMGLPPCVRSGVRYLEDNPQSRDEDAWLLVTTSVGNAWNCPQTDLGLDS